MPSSRPARRPTVSPSTAVSALGSVCLVAWWCHLADRTLDLTDEGYYLNLLHAPHDADTGGTVYLFGYLLHGPYVLLGGDIAALRRLGWLLEAAAAAAVLAKVVDRFARSRSDRSLRWVVGTAGSSLGLLATAFFPATPSYNTLSFLGLCVAVWGVLDATARRSARRGWFLAGAGTWIAALGKPTTGIVLAVAVAVVALLCGRRVRALTACVLGGLAGIGITLPAMGLTPWAVGTVLWRGYRYVHLVGAHGPEALLPWTNKPFPPHTPTEIVAVAVAVVWAAVVGACLRAGRPRAAELVTTAAVLGGVVLVVGGGALERPPLRYADLGLTWIVPLVGSALALLGGGERTRRPEQALGSDRWGDRPVIALLLLMPGIGSFGTNNATYAGWGQLMLFWVCAALAAILLRHPCPRAAVGWLMSAALVVSCALSVGSWAAPYRSPSAFGPGVPAPVGPMGSELRLDPTLAAAARQAAALRRGQGGERPGIIDVSGMAPGYVFLLGGRPLGQGWIQPWGPGAVPAAGLAMSYESCDAVSRAWILRVPGRGAFEDAVLAELGLDGRGYTRIGSLVARPAGPGRPDGRVDVLAPVPDMQRPGRCTAAGSGSRTR